MNSPSEVRQLPGPGSFAAVLCPEDGAWEGQVAPLEFRALPDEDLELPPNDALAGQCSGDRRAWQGAFDVGSSPGQRNAEHNGPETVEAARAEGLERGEGEGRARARAEMEAELQAALVRERERLNGVVASFAATRERYFAEVEQEVVRLALGIAARVLHREAQVDPLLLAGAVRVALEKMAERSGVVLRAAELDVPGWERMVRSMEIKERPKVVGDPSLARGECVLETAMGTIELGVRAQLEEIEKGFFDLLNHRPGPLNPRPDGSLAR